MIYTLLIGFAIGAGVMFISIAMIDSEQERWKLIAEMGGFLATISLTSAIFLMGWAKEK